MPDRQESPTVVIFVTPSGVREVQVHSPSRQAERDGTALYERLRPIVDRMDRAARELCAGLPQRRD